MDRRELFKIFGALSLSHIFKPILKFFERRPGFKVKKIIIRFPEQRTLTHHAKDLILPTGNHITSMKKNGFTIRWIK